MNTANTGTVREIWLHLLRVSDWLTFPEIEQAMAGKQYSNLRTSLLNMEEGGSISVRRATPGKTLYAVTTTSRIVRGLTVRELMAAMPDGQQ